MVSGPLANDATGLDAYLSGYNMQKHGRMVCLPVLYWH